MNIDKTKDEPDIEPTEYAFEEADLPMASKKIYIWSNCETKQLIELYKDFISEVGPLKRFPHKKDMWNEISRQISTKTSKQCDDRFKTLLRRRRKGIEKVCITDLDEKNRDENELHIITKHIRISESNIDDSAALFKQLHVWSKHESKLLMDLYNRLICEVGPQKRFIHKKDMWTEISSHFFNKSSKQCEMRYKTVLKKNKINCTNTASISKKAKRKAIDFKVKYSAENMFKIKSFYTPKNKVGHNQNPKTATIECCNEDRTISETLLEIAAKREIERERRHRAKMQAIEKYQDILEKILNGTKK